MSNFRYAPSNLQIIFWDILYGRSLTEGLIYGLIISGTNVGSIEIPQGRHLLHRPTTALTYYRYTNTTPWYVSYTQYRIYE